MPALADVLGPIIGLVFTTGTILFIALTARWMEEREDLTGLDQPPAKPQA